MKTVYYWISDLHIIGRLKDFIPYLYQKDMGWVVDQEHILMDRVMGYEKSEPSIYGIGSTDMMERVKEISEEEAMQFISNM